MSTTYSSNQSVRATVGPYFDSEINDVAWAYEGVSTALWMGAPLKTIVDTYGVDTGDDQWVTAIGGDEQQDDTDVYACCIPMPKAVSDYLLAYELNSPHIRTLNDCSGTGGPRVRTLRSRRSSNR